LTIDELWRRLWDLEGETFTQIRGGQSTFVIDAAGLRPSRTDWTIPRSHFERALERLPVDNTVPFQDLFGPSYLYAILTDPRVIADAS
jgi:hypothetical protein